MYPWLVIVERDSNDQFLTLCVEINCICGNVREWKHGLLLVHHILAMSLHHRVSKPPPPLHLSAVKAGRNHRNHWKK